MINGVKKMNKTVASLVLLSLMASSATWATSTSEEAATQAHSTTTQESIKREQEKQSDLLKKANSAVTEGMDNVLKAVELLKEKKDGEALKALETAVGKFDIAIAAEPDLALAPVDSYVTLFDLVATPDTIREQLKTVKELIDDGKVQEARKLLSSLRDEMEISTVYLPLATYPDAIKLAVKYLRNEKREQAIATLDTTVKSLVTKTTAVPLGLIRAKSLIEQASKLDKEKDKKKILDLVKEAREQLTIANLLGYTQEFNDSYIDLKKQIVALENEIRGKNAVEKLYEKLAHSFAELMKKETAAPGQK